jgi:hypothetical protein
MAGLYPAAWLLIQIAATLLPILLGHDRLRRVSTCAALTSIATA